MKKASKGEQCKSPVSPMLDSISSDDFDEGDLCVDVEISSQKPHFLDYNYVERTENTSERIKTDKNEKLINHDDLCSGNNYRKREDKKKKKHFLDENPIPPPEYSFKEETLERKHRSLDRNCDRDRDSSEVQTTSEPKKYSLNLFPERETIHFDTFRGTWPTLDSHTNAGQQKANCNTTTDINLGPKVECVYSLLNMLGQHNTTEMAAKFFELSKNRDTCIALRRSGCISILVQLLHSESEEIVRKQAGAALHNVVHCHIDDKSGRREVRVLKLIEQLIEYSELLKKSISSGETTSDETDRHPIVSIGTLMKTSFDEDHRYAMCSLGALQTISSLVQLDHEAHGAKSEDPNCITLRRYAGMTLTNLTFGDGNNKALLCSNKSFMKSLVMQIESSSDELVQVTASVLRNLSWRADTNMKQVLNEIGAIKILTKAAMACSQENTLKSILSALWNLSNHCSINKAEFCECEGAIEFLIDMLNYDAPSKTMAVVENAGGILRNISTYIATKEEYRQILRRRNCYSILLEQLKSSSLTVVSNASGTLGTLSANCVEDQKFLRDNTAIPMLRSLVYSKHKMISTGSSIALKNLLNYQKTGLTGHNVDSVSRSMDLKELPTLNVRKQRALEQELDHNLSYSCDNDDVCTHKDGKLLNLADPKENIKYSNQKDKQPEKMNPISEDKKSHLKENGPKSTSYQESDVDQPVNFSIRYAENVTELDTGRVFERQRPSMEEDCVHMYYTEGTPRVTSNSGSLTDLRDVGDAKEKSGSQSKLLKITQSKNNDTISKKTFTPAASSGPLTPEKPFNYCEEGTPGDFSRSDSLSNLGDLDVENINLREEKESVVKVKDEPESTLTKTVTFSNNVDGTLLETPLIFSRHSSVESLESAGSVCVADDKSSVVSEFSRLASGIMSPYEIPDSPTQPITIQTNTFVADNIPIHFSSATSLSNLSIDDEPKITKDCLVKEMQLISHPSEEHEDTIEKQNLDNDNYLLEQAISIGIRSSTRRKLTIGASCNNSDITKEYYTEDTPAPLSKVGSDSNLSVLSIENEQNRKSENLSSNVSENNDEVLEAAIQDGISTIHAPRNNEFSHQSSLHPLDQLRRGALPPYLAVTDETNNFGLEGSPKTFSIASGLSGLTMGSEVVKLAKLPRENEIKIESEQSKDSSSLQVFNDSLSSLSINSIDDETNILNNAIDAGTRTLTSHRYRANSNDSCSSVDSCDDQQNLSLLELTVQTGINKVAKTNIMPTVASTSTKYFAGSNINDKHYDNDALLEEVINTGISKTTGQFQKTEALKSKTVSKNVETPTSVNLLKNTDVGKEMNAFENKVFQRQFQQPHTEIDQKHSSKSKIDASNISTYSFMSQSNESALKMSVSDILENSFIDPRMEMSNEFIIEEGVLADHNYLLDIDKRKNPDLMVASVDRLTQQLVATAEYLRLTDPNCLRKTKNHSSTNTWNDDSASFPFTENDDENTFNELISHVKPLRHDDTDTIMSLNTNEQDAHLQDIPIRFELGGEVKRPPATYTSCGVMSSNIFSTMTNSTIICLEANKVAAELQNYSPNDSLTSLDNIGPPSELGSVSLSTVTYDVLEAGNSQTYRPRKKSLPTGIIAKRALGQLGGRGSVESVNSLGLDNIKPPSIMDELMDSMTSVASITSEVADNQNTPSFLLSVIDSETNLSIPNETSISSDLSSKESTPKRCLTPKQKRQNSDRYKTYTITGENKNYLKEQEHQEETKDQMPSTETRQFEIRLINENTLNNHNDQLNDSSENNISTFSLPREGFEMNGASKSHLSFNNERISDSISPSCQKNLFEDSLKKAPSELLKNTQKSTTTLKPNRSSLDQIRVTKNESGSSSNSKVVRGSKKPIYVSPYKRTSLNKTNDKTPKLAVAKQVVLKKTVNSCNGSPSKTSTIPQTTTVKSNLPNKINNSILNQKDSLSSKPIVPDEQSRVKTVCKSKTYSSSFVTNSNPQKRIERQGTFTKENGTDLELPVVTSAPTTPSKQKKNVSKTPEKNGSVSKTFISKMRLPLYRSTSTTDPNTSKYRNPIINKSLSGPIVSDNQRSSSSLKIQLNSSSQVYTTAQTKNVLKVEDSKKHQTLRKTTTKLIRSSTFDASPEPGAAKFLPNITKGNTLKIPSSDSLRNISNNTCTQRHKSISNTSLKKYKTDM